MQPGLRALPFVFMMTTGSAHVFGQQLTCYAIRPGDTAAGLAQRFTGNASTVTNPGFRSSTRRPATYVPKSRYGVIQSGWHVCVATEMLRRGSAPTYLSSPHRVATDGCQASANADRSRALCGGQRRCSCWFQAWGSLGAGKLQARDGQRLDVDARVRRQVHFRVRTATASQVRCRCPGQVAAAICAERAAGWRSFSRLPTGAPIRTSPTTERTSSTTLSVCCDF